MNLEDKTDEKLINFIKKGNGYSEEAFRIIYKRYSDRLYSFSLKILKNEQEASDHVQDTFIQFYSKINKFEDRGKGSFRGLIFTITHNEAINKLRSKKYNTCLYIDSLFYYNSKLENISSREEEKIKQEEFKFLRKSIEKLKPEQRQVVYSRCWENKQFNEIAEETNSSTNTMTGRMRYALINLRKIISKSHFFYNQ